MSENMKVYEYSRSVPVEAKKPIQGGRLKGMTDINPMWRIKVLTQLFGVAGQGWYPEITRQWLETGANEEVKAFVTIDLYIKFGEEWGKPISGTGGSSFVANEKGGLYTSDEAFKMAYTDAFSVACKMLGIGADIYFEKDTTKYTHNSTQAPQKATTTKKVEQTTVTPKAPVEETEGLICNKCGVEITKKVNDYSEKKYGKALCMTCQKGE